jgi:hypothetical protein
MKKSEQRKVVSIQSRIFPGAYIYARKNERIPETVLFMAGVFLTVALPQIICTAYGGIIPFIAFATTASAGSILGLVMYWQTPDRIASFVGTRNAPRTAASEEVAEDKAA